MHPTHKLSNEVNAICHHRKMVPIFLLLGKHTYNCLKGAHNTARTKDDVDKHHYMTYHPHWVLEICLQICVQTHFEAFVCSTFSSHCCKPSNMLIRSSAVWSREVGEEGGGAQTIAIPLIISVKQNSSKLTVFEITIPSSISCANLANVAATVARLPVVCSCTFIIVRSKSVRASSSVMLLCVCGRLQRDGSTLSHTPDGLQVLLIMVVVLGQWRDWVVPAEALGHER